MGTLKYFILTGEPGVGKTTLTKKICGLLQDNGVKITGFYTEEVRNNRVREGFDVVTLEGKRGRLARCQSSLTTHSKLCVGKYSVLIDDFENIALSTLECTGSSSCLVIDEIGSMELFREFKNKVKEIFTTNSNNIVLATIPMRKRNPILDLIRKNEKSKLWVINKDNRDSVHEDIIKEMKKSLDRQPV